MKCALAAPGGGRHVRPASLRLTTNRPARTRVLDSRRELPRPRTPERGRNEGLCSVCGGARLDAKLGTRDIAQAPPDAADRSVRMCLPLVGRNAASHQFQADLLACRGRCVRLLVRTETVPRPPCPMSRVSCSWRGERTQPFSMWSVHRVRSERLESRLLGLGACHIEVLVEGANKLRPERPDRVGFAIVGRRAVGTDEEMLISWLKVASRALS